MRLIYLSISLNLVASSFIYANTASREDQINTRLAAFEANPALEMARPLPKHDSAGRLRLDSLFSEKQQRTRDFVLHKDSLRQKIQPLLQDKYKSFERGRGAENLVDIPSNQMLRTLPDIEHAGLTSAKLAETPWSDSYWPIYRGEIAARYSDDHFSKTDWKSAYNYTHTGPNSYNSIFQSLYDGNTPNYSIDLLSPAEKYDLLVGDAAGTLSSNMWNDGAFFAKRGKIETWMGICHGWSAAALMESRPISTVTALAPDGHTPINFYPSDIKALASLLWANARIGSKYVGSRCDERNPARDENGRVLSPACFDVNPGVWHLAIVNQIGQAHRGFVMDATYDYEVWNQPVYSYKYTYFNPERERSVSNIKDATVAIADFKHDKFHKYRSAETASVVGIAMDVTYVLETEPTHVTVDAASRDVTRTVTYLYDLELNSSGEIIGGEWRSNSSPDFLWVHPPGARAINANLAEENWDPTSDTFPLYWSSAAQQVSATRMPLEAVVRSLIRASR